LLLTADGGGNSSKNEQRINNAAKGKNMKSMKPLLTSSDPKGAWPTCSRLFCLGVAATIALATSVPSALGQPRMPNELYNIDTKYPCFRDVTTGQIFYPNDIEIVCYGPELRTNDLVWTWDTSNPFYPVRLNWGFPTVTEVLNYNDTNNPANPANGMNCVSIRWAGPPHPELGPFTGPGLGQYVHIGYQFKPTAGVVHREIWWTVDGVRVTSACDPKTQFICSRSSTTICIENPYPFRIYIYGCRFFLPTTLPRLNDLVTGINPANFGAPNGWTAVPPQVPVLCLQPWCRIYMRIPGPVVWRPVVFQIAASLTLDVQLPPGGGPNPQDTNTVSILTLRSGVIRRADNDGDGIVGSSDIPALQQEYRLENPDLVP
jgi:hypothetical protein